MIKNRPEQITTKLKKSFRGGFISMEDVSVFTHISLKSDIMYFEKQFLLCDLVELSQSYRDVFHYSCELVIRFLKERGGGDVAQ